MVRSPRCRRDRGLDGLGAGEVICRTEYRSRWHSPGRGNPLARREGSSGRIHIAHGNAVLLRDRAADRAVPEAWGISNSEDRRVVSAGLVGSTLVERYEA